MNPRMHEVALGRKLLKRMQLPVLELQKHAAWCIAQHTTLPEGGQGVLADLLLDGVLHEYFVDAEGRQLADVLKRFPALDDAAKELRFMLHRLVSTTTGPLVPSYRYRYELQGDSLILIPTLPTIGDYEQRIEAMADPDEGWVPARYRR